MSQELKQDLLTRVQYGVKVEYEGIVNGKELSEYTKTEPKDDFANGNPGDAWLRWMNQHPEPIEGKKIGLVKNVKICKNYTVFYVGKYHNYSKACFNPKPVLFPLSCLDKEITVDGKTFIPIVELAKIHGFKCNSYRIENENDTIVLYTDYAKHPNIDFEYITESFFEVDVDEFDIDCGVKTIFNGEHSEAFYPVKNQIDIFDFFHKNHINYRLRGEEFVEATNEYA